MSGTEWDNFYIGLCKYIAQKSKDPGMKCGAVIVRPNKSVASLGFNGMPQGTLDEEQLYTDRELKLERVIHAELNCILFCVDKPIEYTIYTWPTKPCARCSAHIIQSGITRVVCPHLKDDGRWNRSFEIGAQLFKEAGIQFDVLNEK